MRLYGLWKSTWNKGQINLLDNSLKQETREGPNQ
jgi:hypothetical protein